MMRLLSAPPSPPPSRDPRHKQRRELDIDSFTWNDMKAVLKVRGCQFITSTEMLRFLTSSSPLLALNPLLLGAIHK